MNVICRHRQTAPHTHTHAGVELETECEHGTEWNDAWLERSNVPDNSIFDFILKLVQMRTTLRAAPSPYRTGAVIMK